MKFSRLGNSSLEVSKLAIGALHFGNMCDKKLAAQIIGCGADLGINFIDTAPMYGNGLSESIVGEAIQGHRNKFVIATKVGLEPIVNAQGHFGVRTVPLTRNAIRESLHRSLKNLATDHVDLFQLHAFDATAPADETMSALTELVSEGKVREIGCSNYDRAQLTTMTDAMSRNGAKKFVTLQSHYNIVERRLETDLLPICERENISILCYRALARGILSKKYAANTEPPPGSRGAMSERVRKRLTSDTLQLVELLNDLGAPKGLPANHVALAWLTEKNYVGASLLGMRDVQQVKENVAAVDLNLTPSALKEIDDRIQSVDLMAKVMADPDTFLET